MDELIEALTIFRKYKNERWPTFCSHDKLSIMAVTEKEVSADDAKQLDKLGFFWSDEDDCWISFRFGSA